MSNQQNNQQSGPPGSPILLFLSQKKDNLLAAVPRTVKGALVWETIIQGVALALNAEKTGPKLQACTPQSVYLSLLTILRLGLDPAPVAMQAFLIPRGTTCTPQIGAQGKIELAYRSGKIEKLVCQVVYEADDFEIDLANGNVIHKITKEQLLEGPANPGKALACYARVWIKGVREPFTELMRRHDFEKIKAMSQSPAYGKWEDEMYRRSTLNRALKRAPKSADFSELLDDGFEIKETALPDVIEAGESEEDTKGGDTRELPDHGESGGTDYVAEAERLKQAEKAGRGGDEDPPFGRSSGGNGSGKPAPQPSGSDDDGMPS